MNSPASLELWKFAAPKIVHGSRAIHFVGRYAKNFGAGKALVLGRGVGNTNYIKRSKPFYDLHRVMSMWAVQMGTVE